MHSFFRHGVVGVAACRPTVLHLFDINDILTAYWFYVHDMSFQENVKASFVNFEKKT